MSSLCAAATVATVLAALAGTSRADTFGGFSGVDRPYLINQDRVCTPLPVVDNAARGAPSCQPAAADLVAHFDIKPPVPQRGAKATFAATAAGRTLTVTRKTGEPVVAWDAPDAIGKIVEVFAAQYDDRVAVAYTTKRAGREVTDVVAFDLGQAGAAVVPDDHHVPTPTVTAPAPVEDPAVTKLVAAARKAGKLAAWQAVLAADAAHSEALFRISTLQAAKQPADALATLATLAKSAHPDAIEWLIEARFDPAFAALRADPTFRAAVGLDRKPAEGYERLMGFGGQWEQTGTSCDQPEVRFIAARDRSVSIRVKSACEGKVFSVPFKGTWRIDGDRVILTLPTKGKQVSAADEAPCKFEAVGDEDGLRCAIGRDIDFLVLPTRR